MYTLISTYDDGFSKSECVNDITQAFAAAAIYAIDEECVSILCLNNETRDFVIDFHR